MGKQNQCKLTKKGETARNLLLKLLYDNSYTLEQINQDTGLDRTATIPKILGQKKGSLRLKTLEDFFRKLLQRIKEQCGTGKLILNDVIRQLQEYGLYESYKKLEEPERNFHLSDTLYSFADDSFADDVEKSLQRQRQKVQSKKPAALSKNSITDLLWHLDYKQQERHFDDALERQTRSIAFSIVAPCDTTQRWILNRLMRRIPNRENALILPAIKLKTHRMREQFEHFWQDLAQRFGTESGKDQVLREMCHANTHHPIILTVYEFRQLKNAQKQLIEEFWEPLSDMMKHSKRSPRSRVVMFLVDQTCLNQETTTVVKLSPMESITCDDIESWRCSDLVAQWWQSKSGVSEPDFTVQLDLEADLDPYEALDTICRGLGANDGVIDVESAWRWAS